MDTVRKNEGEWGKEKYGDRKNKREKDPEK